MKKTLFLTLVFFLFSINYTNAQLSKFVKNVKNNVQKDMLGGQDQNQNTGKKTMPEPACACTDAIPVLALDKFQLDYSEISISSDMDGNLLVSSRHDLDYYIVKDGVTKGPYKKGDPALVSFGVTGDELENNNDNVTTNNTKEPDFILKNKEYFTKAGEKYMITFMGKKYGPYARINQFVVNRDRDKFAAVVIENLSVAEELNKKMEAEANNAKTDEQKMNIAMKYAQQIQSSIMEKGVPNTAPSFITSVPGLSVEPNIFSMSEAQINSDFKYDEFLLYYPYGNTITDMKGKEIMKYATDKVTVNFSKLFISADNSRYVFDNYGTLTFNDNSKLPDVVNPHWLKANGKVYLAYDYYSPKSNSIMQCKIPF